MLASSANRAHCADRTLWALFMLAAYGLTRPLSPRQVALTISWACLVYIILGVAVEIGLGMFRPWVNGYRFTGTAHPNTQAVYGAIVCLTAGLYARQGSRWDWKPAAVFGVGILCLLLTRSRTSLAGLGVGMIAMQALKLRPQQRVLTVASALFFVGAFGLGLSLIGSRGWNQIGTAAAMGRTADVGTLTGRLPLWEYLAEDIQQRPWLGHGYLAYWSSAQVEFLSNYFGWKIPHGHNMYVDVLLDGGVLGLVLFLWVFVAAIWMVLRRYAATCDPAAAVALGLVVFALMNGAAESFFKMPTFMTFALAMVLARLVREPEP